MLFVAVESSEPIYLDAPLTEAPIGWLVRDHRLLGVVSFGWAIGFLFYVIGKEYTQGFWCVPFAQETHKVRVSRFNVWIIH